MKLKGKLVKILEEQKGISKAGKDWIKQEFVIDTGSDYNPEVCISVFGVDKVNGLKKFKVGQDLEVDVNVYSREWKGKYFHSIDAWQIELASQNNDNQNMPF